MRIKQFSWVIILAGSIFNLSFLVGGDFKSRYLEKSKNTSSIVCDYVQEKKISQVKEPVISKGKFYYSKPGKIRLEQQIPSENLIILNSDSLFTKENGKVQKMGMDDHPYFKYLNDLILGTVNGEVFDEKHFEVTFLEKEGETFLQLVPKARMMKRKFSQINLKFDTHTLSLSSIEMVEKSGDAVTMSFIQPVFNSVLRSALFKL